MRHLHPPWSLSVTTFLLIAFATVACRSTSRESDLGAQPGLRFEDPRAHAPEPTFKTDTLQARNIVLVDENGKQQLVLSGGESRLGPVILLGDEDDGAGLMLGYFHTGQDQKGPRAALLHAESGELGNLSLSVEPKGAHLFMGSDQTDQFEITCDKDGLLISIEPKEVGNEVPSKTVATEGKVPTEARGVRITLDHGRIVVHDLAGHELGALADPATLPK